VGYHPCQAVARCLISSRNEENNYGLGNVDLFQTLDAAGSLKDLNERQTDRQAVEGFIAATSFQTLKLKEGIY
jgi:hypothetical protein